MRILLIASAYNGMTQRVHVELADRGHEVSVELALAQLRRAFVYKAKPPHAPPHLARHRTHPWPSRPGQSPAPTPSALARQLGPLDGWFAAGRADGREEEGAKAATPVPAGAAAGC